jgi:ABC-type bacteriocin/lantibiotic exporter with double-glycine peptidase domain
MLKIKNGVPIFMTRNIQRYYSQQTQPLIQMKNATIQRFGVKQPVFQDFSLTIERDQRWVIVGPVNAGKTTLAEVSNSLYTFFLFFIFYFFIFYKKLTCLFFLYSRPWRDAIQLNHFLQCNGL